MKNNIRIIVQDSTEPGAEFAKRLEKICEDPSKEFEETIIDFPNIHHMTTASDGRQTATIQFLTLEEGEEFVDDDEEFEFNAEDAAAILSQAMEENKELRESYKANIAKAFYEECKKNQVDDDLPLEHLAKIADKAADNFLNSWLKID
ncbi:MAG: hypothetical protein AABY15_03245 [Nanoarchaeota archaeon]